MKFILLIILTGMGGGGMNQFRQPAVTTAVFEDQKACESAAYTMEHNVTAWAKGARVEYPAIRAFCLPAASGQ